MALLFVFSVECFDICFLVFLCIYRITGLMMISRIDLVHQTCQLNMRMSLDRANVLIQALHGTLISSHMLMDSHSNCVVKARGRQYVNDAYVVFYLPRADNMRWKHKAVSRKCTNSCG